MNVLVINCGSSSLKYQLIDSESENVLAKGLCERIGIDGRLVYQKAGLDKEITDAPMPTHKEAIQLVLDALTNEKTGAIKSLKEVDVVHGGEKFASSVIINDEVIKAVEECNDLAPLHNPANLIGINVCSELMPGVPQVAVFDTAFHQTMPPKAYLYGLPIRYYKDYKVRRYGFHGTSHSYVSKRAVEFLGLDPENWADQSLFEPAFIPEYLLSSTGAGDAAIAAFLTALLQGCKPEECLQMAVAEGAASVTAYDALSGLKSLEELREKIRRGWEKTRYMT